MQMSCKICRRLGVSLCGSRSCAFLKRPQPPGEHGESKQSKDTPYGVQLKESQKLRFYYGISAKQFRRYYGMASKSKRQTNVYLIQMLETRLDNMVYRLGFTGTLASARQMVTHRHILVNGKNVNKPSYRVNVGDVVQLREKSQKIERYQEWFHFFKNDIPYIERHESEFSGQLTRLPDRHEVPIQVEDQLVVEFMAR